VNIQKGLVNALGFHARVLDMPTDELGASAYRKYDVEAWMPGRRGKWGEICSASNCTDYQARRLQSKVQTSDGSKDYVHTLNATAMAAPRALIAILENNYDGRRVRIPSVLRKWMNDAEYIEKEL